MLTLYGSPHQLPPSFYMTPFVLHMCKEAMSGSFFATYMIAMLTHTIYRANIQQDMVKLLTRVNGCCVGIKLY